MPRTRTGRPNGVKLKKLKPSTPWRSSSLFTTRFGAVATSVIMPLMSAAKLSGIISRPGADTGALRDAQHDWNEDRRNGRRTHRRAEAADDHHQKDDQPDFAASGLRDQPVAEPPRDACPHQAVADHEQRGDQDDVRIAEARQRLAHREHARERQCHEHDQRDGVHAGPVDREHHDRGREQG